MVAARFGAHPPPACAAWTTQKWAAQLDLPRFAPSSEQELNDWVDAVAPRVASCDPTLAAFLTTACLNAAVDAAAALRNAATVASNIWTLYDLADSLSYQLFVRPQQALRLERQIWKPTRQPRVLTAVRHCREIITRYARVCARHGRYPAVYEPQLIDFFLATIPEAAERQILAHGEPESLDHLVRQACLLQENLPPLSRPTANRPLARDATSGISGRNADLRSRRAGPVAASGTSPLYAARPRSRTPLG